MKTFKHPRESTITKSEVVCPNDTNPLGILKGGRLVEWMDMAAAVCAQLHAERICVTASMNSVNFFGSVKCGDILFISARITRSFRSSMEIQVEVTSTTCSMADRKVVAVAFLTFVALDEKGISTPVMKVKPESGTDKLLYDSALLRRQQVLNQ